MRLLSGQVQSKLMVRTLARNCQRYNRWETINPSYIASLYLPTSYFTLKLQIQAILSLSRSLSANNNIESASFSLLSKIHSRVPCIASAFTGYIWHFHTHTYWQSLIIFDQRYCIYSKDNFFLLEFLCSNVVFFFSYHGINKTSIILIIHRIKYAQLTDLVMRL